MRQAPSAAGHQAAGGGGEEARRRKTAEQDDAAAGADATTLGAGHGEDCWMTDEMAVLAEITKAKAGGD